MYEGVINKADRSCRCWGGRMRSHTFLVDSGTAWLHSFDGSDRGFSYLVGYAYCRFTATLLLCSIVYGAGLLLVRRLIHYCLLLR